MSTLDHHPAGHSAARPRPLSLLVRVHADRRVAGAAAVVLVAVVGLLSGLVLPRGPVTSGQSVSVLVLCSALGAAAGLLTASRWSVLLAPAVFGTAFELARIPAVGPTVDGIHLGSVYGVAALVAGRGFDALVMGFPLAVGAVWGAAAGRRLTRRVPPGRRRAGGYVRRGAAVLAAVLVLALAAALLRPARTAPIVGADGAPLPGSVAELTTVAIGGHEQSIMIRGHDRDNPVLLFLEGGPGGTALGAMRASGQGLEEDFVVAVWDQRGTGKSLSALEPTATMTVEQMVADTVAVADHLRNRFGQEKIYLVGSSWGTTLGVLAVQQAPEKFHAYVGSGQMVDQQETDRRMYAETLAWAERTGETDFAQRLRDNGPPPYTDMLAYPDALSTNPEYRDFPHGDDFDPASQYPVSLFVEEYTLTEQVRAMGGIIDTFAVLYPQLQDIDFRRDVPELGVPVYVVEGAHESPGRSDLAVEWFEDLDAPDKELVVLDRSGHTPHLDQPSRFHDVMIDTVLARTGGPDRP
ncbi:alpha/beta fold hydrolase [Kocuria sp. NPDC057446]|uniref:alpha/beta fold hydrolase n=1 Tax=Kocuria sp. NPDC057446 TaxID=3346137 RepID=UPI0036C3078A